MEHGIEFPNEAAVLIASIIACMHHGCSIIPSYWLSDDESLNPAKFLSPGS